jgi:hypothetical protein
VSRETQIDAETAGSTQMKLRETAPVTEAVPHIPKVFIFGNCPRMLPMVEVSRAANLR